MEVTHKVKSGWKNQKRVSVVLCDKIMNMKDQEEGYRTVGRPALVYGADTWALQRDWR